MSSRELIRRLKSGWAYFWRDQAIKGIQLSTNQVYIEAVNRVGRRIANAISERPDLADDWEFTVIDSSDH